MNWEEIWQSIKKFFVDNVWNIIGWFVVLIVGVLFIQVFLHLLKRIMRRRKVDEMAVRFIAACFRLVLWIVLILILLALMGVPVTGLTTAFSAAVLAIGMALKEFLANVASGLVLIVSNKYKTGDFITIKDVEGKIIDINFLFTTIMTPNNTQVTLPNSMLTNSAVTNLDANPSRRVAIDFSVAYESDTELVKKTLIDVMLSNGKVHTNPEPLCRLKTLGESSIDYFLTCYCDSCDYWDVYFYIMDQGFDACKRAGIQFPFKQIELTQKKPVDVLPTEYPSLPERVEKERVVEEKGITVEEFEDMTLREKCEYLTGNSKQQKAKREAKKAEEKEQKPKESSQKAKKKPAKK